MMCFVLGASVPVYSGVFEFSGAANGSNVVSHPTGYTGVGGNLIVTVGISPTSPHAAEMVVPVQNVVNTWNHLVPTIGNVVSDGINIPFAQFDFESIALHEMGHCIGLSHPNLASESGLSGEGRNYTKSTRGPNNTFEVNSGVDGIIGSSDDVRGDDINLHWFRRSDNNPFGMAGVVDKTTYSRNIADLPAGHLFATNADRDVSMLFGVQNTESVMQQGIFSGETRRSLSADDVATLSLGMSGLDMIAGTSDDYILNLQYAGFTDAADIVFNFDNLTSFAACRITGVFINQDHLSITSGHISFNTNFSWFFNDLLVQVGPVVSILANNQSGAITIDRGDALSITVTLDPGVAVGNLADYWVRALTPAGTFWLDDQLQFIRSDSAIRAFGGPLIGLTPFSIFNGTTTELSSGTYTLIFAVDDNIDGIVNGTFNNTVTITINP